MRTSCNRSVFCGAVLTLLGLLAAQTASAQRSNVLINFDDVPVETGIGTQLTDALSGVLVPDRIYLMSMGNPNYPNTDLGCRSGSNCVFNFLQQQFGFRSNAGPVTLSGWIRGWNVRGAFNSDDAARNILIEGFDASGNLVGSQTLALTRTYTQFVFSALFTEVRFTPLGAPWFGPCTTCGRVLLDDLVINPTVTPEPSVVPEPATGALLLTGLLGLVAVAHRRRAVRG